MPASESKLQSAGSCQGLLMTKPAVRSCDLAPGEGHVWVVFGGWCRSQATHRCHGRLLVPVPIKTQWVTKFTNFFSIVDLISILPFYAPSSVGLCGFYCLQCSCRDAASVRLHLLTPRWILPFLVGKAIWPRNGFELQDPQRHTQDVGPRRTMSDPYCS